MTRTVLFGLVLFAACTRATTGGEPQPAVPAPEVTTGPGVKAPPPAPPPAVKLELTAVTLADDCGGTAPRDPPPPPTTPPPAPPPAKAKAKSALYKADLADDSDNQRKAKRRCEQTSMQISVVSTAGAPTQLQVKSVELLDDTGTSIGTLTASAPTRWSSMTSSYEAWDEQVGANQQLSVSYVLSQPAWDGVASRWNRTYTLNAVITVGTEEQAVTRNVMVSAPTSLPPNVKT